ncbi:PNCB phosphoribosyltransferase, partial [Campylorhamphus procurvoides]|nr:PNCB phosphoribosyltransferase [Campylorhamphus procurvoides]
ADVAYLRSVLPSSTDDAFFEFLATLDASEVTVTAAPEGSVVFARVPFLQVKGPLLVVQLLETTLLCLVNYARYFGNLGRSQNSWKLEKGRKGGTRGGIGTSQGWVSPRVPLRDNPWEHCIVPGMGWDTPPVPKLPMPIQCQSHTPWQELPPQAGGDPVDLPGLAMSWLERVCDLLQIPAGKTNQGELAAFVSYAVTFPCDFQGLLDTYCVRRSGLPNFCAVALALHQLGYRAIGVRLDSGNLAQQAKEIRGALRACGARFQVPWFGTIPIAVSNDISESSLEELSQEVPPGTAGMCPSLVPQLVEVNGSPCLKLTEDEEKMTIPGVKTIYRLYDAAGHPFMDLMALEEEPPPRAGQEVAIRVLGNLGEATTVVPAVVEPLHRLYFRDGQVCEPLPSLAEVRTHAQVSLKLLSPAHRRLHEPQPYPVAVTERLHRLFLELRQAGQ